MLIRFDDSSRGPTAQLWHGLVDWVSGSQTSVLGARDFDDFSPFNSGFMTVGGTSGAAASFQDTRDGDSIGEVLFSATAGTNAEVGVTRHIRTRLDKVRVVSLEARLRRVDSADAQITAFGLTDQSVANILASNALAVGSNQDFIGFRWNDNGTIDIVSIVDGALTALASGIATASMGSSSYTKMGLRIERQTPTVYRLVPAIDGEVKRSNILTVASSALPSSVVLRPGFAAGTDATTAPQLMMDWIFVADR